MKGVLQSPNVDGTASALRGGQRIRLKGSLDVGETNALLVESNIAV